jgi:hypothetical protein
VGNITAIEDETRHGFQLNYYGGDHCNTTTWQQWGTKINFLCDIHEEAGWPSFDRIEDCTAHFNWHTIYACKLCEKADIIKLEGECIDGTRQIKEIARQNCIFLGKHRVAYEEHCSTLGELLGFWQVVCGLIVLTLIALLSIISFCCFFR